MRFKKLKVFVAMAMVIFLLVAGNIIAIGLSQHNQQQVAPVQVISSNKGSGQLTPTIINTTTDSSVSQNQQTASAAPAQTPVQTAPPVIFQQRMTRAS